MLDDPAVLPDQQEFLAPQNMLHPFCSFFFTLSLAADFLFLPYCDHCHLGHCLCNEPSTLFSISFWRLQCVFIRLIVISFPVYYNAVEKQTRQCNTINKGFLLEVLGCFLSFVGHIKTTIYPNRRNHERISLCLVANAGFQQIRVNSGV